MKNVLQLILICVVVIAVMALLVGVRVEVPPRSGSISVIVGTR